MTAGRVASASSVPFPAAHYSGGEKGSTLRFRSDTETAKAQFEFSPPIGLVAELFNGLASPEPDASAGRGFVVEVWSRRTGFFFGSVCGGCQPFAMTMLL